jgi:phospholipid-translocating ATPase
MVFFIPYLVFIGTSFVTFEGMDVEDRLRFGAYIAHPAVITINLYILINTYRWDWIMLLVCVFSDLFVFFWTGIYSQFTGSGYFYKAAVQVYGEATFWAVFFIVPVICIFPRFAVKAIQKVYFPYDVDIIREQERQGKFGRLADKTEASGALSPKARTPSGSTDTHPKKHQPFGSVDEECRPIYPPSVVTQATTTHNVRSQNGSDGTNYTGHRSSMDAAAPMVGRSSIERTRPSYDRIRASMDRMRPSFEASSEITSAARLSRIESSQSWTVRRPRMRGLSLSKTHQ